VSLQLFFPIVTQVYAATEAPQEGITGVELAKILGLGLGVLTLGLIFFVYIYHRKSILSQTARWLHFLSLCVIPLFLLFLGNFVAFEGAEQQEFCASCHIVMDHYVNDQNDPKSSTLAAIHNQNRYIREAKCYACHVGYGINGTAKAKMNGLKHMYKYFTGTWARPIKLYEPFSNANCLHCHTGDKKFEENDVHIPLMSDIISNAMSCLDCHGPAHPEQVASKKSEGGGK